MSVHLYTAKGQPATRYVDNLMEGKPLVFTTKPHKRITCCNCYKQREARNLLVQVYYDSTRFYCKEGCKTK